MSSTLRAGFLRAAVGDAWRFSHVPARRVERVLETHRGFVQKLRRAFRLAGRRHSKLFLGEALGLFEEEDDIRLYLVTHVTNTAEIFVGILRDLETAVDDRIHILRKAGRS